jgi:glycosyltransferase involved in cell wall biosynthesis
VGDLIAAADVVCLASAAEASPLVLLEAMALGRPVVAPDVGGVTEIVAHRRTGLVIPPLDDDALAQAVHELAQDRALARELGSAGRERHRSAFDAERMNDAYAEVLVEVAAERRARPASR